MYRSKIHIKPLVDIQSNIEKGVKVCQGSETGILRTTVTHSTTVIHISSPKSTEFKKTGHALKIGNLEIDPSSIINVTNDKHKLCCFTEKNGARRRRRSLRIFLSCVLNVEIARLFENGLGMPPLRSNICLFYCQAAKLGSFFERCQLGKTTTYTEDIDDTVLEQLKLFHTYLVERGDGVIGETKGKTDWKGKSPGIFDILRNKTTFIKKDDNNKNKEYLEYFESFGDKKTETVEGPASEVTEQTDTNTSAFDSESE